MRGIWAALALVGVAATATARAAPGATDVCPVLMGNDCRARAAELTAAVEAASPGLVHWTDPTAEPIVVYQFFADWCTSCSGITRTLMNAGIPGHQSRVYLVRVNVDKARHQAKPDAFVGREHLLSISDPGGRLFHRLFPDESVPKILVVRGRANVLAAYSGHLAFEDLDSLNRLIGADTHALPSAG